jgi:SAM-dependent methyltransferase
VVGEAVARTVGGLHLLEYPIWMWHWAGPADIVWDDLVALDIDVSAKEAAIAEYESQLGAILRPDFMEHFSRDVEVYFATRSLNADYFDGLYAKRDDPWRLATRWYEERKRAVTIAALPSRRFGRALEIGSSIGLLTTLLADRCDDVVAIDISAAALETARTRVPSNVELQQADASVAFPTGSFDLIVLSEVGYYFDATVLAQVVGDIASALAPGGSLLACHWRHPVDDYPLSGDAVHRIIATGLPFERIVTHVERDFLLDVYSLDTRSVAEREGLA